MPATLRSCWACRHAVEELQIESLLALPLTEGNGHNSNDKDNVDDQVGVLILTQETNRVWSPSEVLVIRTLSDQVVDCAQTTPVTAAW